MARAGIEQYLYLLDAAFAGPDWHSLLTNVRALTADDWLWLPSDGARPIAEMVAHVVGTKYRYERRLASVTPSAIEELVAWLEEGQRCLRASVDALSDDADPLRPRRTNWGDVKETRWIVKAIIEHDLYHAGEINRMRALRQQNDRWAYESVG